jgi:GNAT superfamily N-acetyltransferase
MVGAFDGVQFVGAPTGTPMEEHADDFAKAFSSTAYALWDIFYCAESVLLSKYRGRGPGAGHRFFYAHEAHARSLGRRYAAFCSVIRSADHPQRPDAYNALDPFWRKRGYAVHILAENAPVFDLDIADRPVNRAHLFSPKGAQGTQDKQIMTRFEREVWGVASGGPLQIFETSSRKIGILICYDAEFPLLVHTLADADVILVPSCTVSMGRVLAGLCGCDGSGA